MSCLSQRIGTLNNISVQDLSKLQHLSHSNWIYSQIFLKSHALASSCKLHQITPHLILFGWYTAYCIRGLPNGQKSHQNFVVGTVHFFPLFLKIPPTPVIAFHASDNHRYTVITTLIFCTKTLKSQSFRFGNDTSTQLHLEYFILGF